MAKDVKFCSVDLPESWKSALSAGKIPIPDTERLSTFAVAPDGSRVFGIFYSREWSGIAAVDRRGNVTRIKEVTDPNHDVLGGADFDGRWLVWGTRPSAQNLGVNKIWAWDSVTGEVTNVVGSQGQGAYSWFPVVSQGWLAYERDQPGNSQYERHVYSLADGKDRVVSTGSAAAWMVFWGTKLIVIEPAQQGIGGKVDVVDAATGAPSVLPKQLDSLGSSSYLSANGNFVAWDAPGGLYAWRPGDADPTRLDVPNVQETFGSIEWIRVAGDFVTWSGDKKQWVADLRSHGIAPVTIQWGDRLTNGNAMLVSQIIGPISKSDDPLTGSVYEDDVVDVTKLPPLPGCP